MHKIGLIVNPVAGMGGSVGLKGTDGEMHAKALALGAEPVAPARTREFLTHIGCGNRIKLLVAPGEMGADHALATGLEHEIVGNLVDSTPTPADTISIARQMLANEVDLIVFAGGDGTARDMVDAIGLQVPVIAIPSGVKIYSSVFAFSPRAAAELLDAFVDGAEATEEEVLDIDEDAFRDGRVDSRHYGFLLVPASSRLVQAGKSATAAGNGAEVTRDIAAAVVDSFDPAVLYLLGSGTTIRAIADVLGIEKTLLGVDAVLDGRLVGSDLNERAILELLDEYPAASIVVTPLGGNGFIFGRGNKQFTPDVLRSIGRENIVVVANPAKLLGLPCLHVDTGDPALDEALSGYLDVVIGLGHSKLMRVQ